MTTDSTDDNTTSVTIALYKDGVKVGDNQTAQLEGGVAVQAFDGLADAGSYYATAYNDGFTPSSVKSDVYTVAQGGGVVDKASTFADGTVTSAQDNLGRAVSAVDGVYTFQYDGNAHYVKPLKVTTAIDGEVVDVDASALKYYADTNKNGVYDKGYDAECTSPDNDIKASGTYFVVAKPTSTATEYAGAENVSTFVIAAGSFGEVTAFEGDDVEDAEFAFTNESLEIGFANDGAKLDPTSDYDVEWKTADGVVVADVKDAGTYTATVTGKNAYAGSKATVTVTVAKYDLATAGLAIADRTTAEGSLDVTQSANVTLENGITGLNALVDFEITGGKVPAVKGAYTVTVAPKEAAEANVEGTAKLVVNVVDSVVPAASYEYDGKELSDINGKTFDASKGEAFDASKVKVVRATVGTTKYYYGSDAYTVTVYDKDGNVVTAANASGDYTVVVSMNPGEDFAVGGKASADFKVTSGTLKNAVVSALYDGKTLAGASVEYSGEDVLAGMDLTVTLGETELAAGADYKVTCTKDGKEVDSAVDKGAYTVKVEGVSYDGSAQFNFNIAALDVTGVKVDTGDMGALAWTGEEIVPTVLYTTEDAPFDADTEWSVLPADVYKLTYQLDGKAVDAVVDEGEYVADLSLYTDVVNYGLNASLNVDGMSFEVAKAVGFADVASDAWYAEYVALASKTDVDDYYGYMNGIPGTKLFLPEGQITRAQTAQVLFNMAGGGGTGYYPTQFSDVDPEAWYAKPIWWASNAGIVTGIGDTGTFAPDQNVTREQVATMLWRYAKAQGKDVSGSADLTAYADGASVSEWAAEAMAWAVDAGVFGVGTDVLRPQDNLTRAEMAAISVRVQPDGAVKLPTE